MAERQLLVVVADRDEKLFNVVGPVADDSDLNRRVTEAQEGGRDVHIPGSSETSTREELIAEAERDLGFKYTDRALV